MKIFRLILVSYFSAFSVFPVPSYGSDESQNLTGHSLSNKQIISELSSDVVDSSHFTVQLVEDMSTFSIDTFGGLGDVSLYVKRGEKPSYDNYDCASLKEGNDENCTLNNVVAGEYHIVLHGDYENTQISALWENNNLMDNTNANEESASNSCEGDDTCVVNYNKIVKLGHLSTAVVPIQWQDSPYFSTARGGPNKLQDWYNRVSRGKVQLKGKNGADKITILKTVKTDLKAACSNRKKAANVARSETNIGHHNIRIYDYAGNVCGYAANANGSARGGNIYVNSSVGNRATTTHEMGHVFKLGHSAVLTTKKGKLTTSSVDRTTPMGSWGLSPTMHHNFTG